MASSSRITAPVIPEPYHTFTVAVIMSSADVIILYDIPATDPKRKAWSPNTWKARYVDSACGAIALSSRAVFAYTGMH